MSSDVTNQVRRLVQAENECNRDKANSILAQNFIAITRSNGQERERNILLDGIEKPLNPNIHRTISDMSPVISGDLAVVRSLVTTTDTSKPEAASGRFRNIHVFENQQGNWRCVLWQVTKLE